MAKNGCRVFNFFLRFTQHAGTTALRSSQDCVAEMLAQYNERRSVLVEGTLASIFADGLI